jgi:DNA-binding MarR family transcriptional regulator
MDSYVRLAGELTALLRGMKDLHAHVVERAPVSCEPAGAIVLGRLSVLGPVRLTVLASELGLDPSSVSRQVAVLERAGLLSKERDDSDLRAQRLVLTDAGQAAVETLRASFAERLAELTPGFSAKEVAELADRLARLNTEIKDHRALLGDRQETA